MLLGIIFEAICACAICATAVAVIGVLWRYRSEIAMILQAIVAAVGLATTAKKAIKKDDPVDADRGTPLQ